MKYQRLAARLSTIVYLTLEMNNLKSISKNTFEGLVNLESLELETNKISYIADTAFSKTTKLKYFGLAENKLETIEECTFDPLKKCGRSSIWNLTN